jgi:hypothetical protein
MTMPIHPGYGVFSDVNLVGILRLTPRGFGIPYTMNDILDFYVGKHEKGSPSK